MSMSGLMFGIGTFLVFLLSISPIFIWLNLINIPVAILGLLFSIIGILHGKQRLFGSAGVVICIIVISLGVFRLFYAGDSTLP